MNMTTCLNTLTLCTFMCCRTVVILFSMLYYNKNFIIITIFLSFFFFHRIARNDELVLQGRKPGSLRHSALWKETHLTPSTSPGIAVTSSETHLTPSTSPGIVLTTPETHLSLSTSPGVVYGASEARVTPSTAPEISLMYSQQAHGYPPVAPSISNTYGIGTQVKLSKLDLKKFNGDISKWPSFWDAFESSVHNNTRLAAIDKFNYLNSLLVKSASEAISGLSITAANYDEAVTILKRRFGNNS